jgi:hypothetical protein
VAMHFRSLRAGRTAIRDVSDAMDRRSCRYGCLKNDGHDWLFRHATSPFRR